MGGASSGGSDNDVSGNEAVYTGGTTYSSKKTKTVNKEIAETNKKNRDDRKSPITKGFEKTLIGKTANKISNSKFAKDSNYKSRVAFAKKTGRFKDTDLSSREFVLSKGFKNQLDGMGYSEKPADRGGNDNNTALDVVAEAPTMAEVDQAQSTTSYDTSSDNTLTAAQKKIRTNKKGRRDNILTSAQGLGKNNLIIKKNRLGAG
jgi:hypothetical protein